ncbi:MAG: GH1 family beta-glucosidase [Anaerolineae bacterium]
MPFPQDFVWGTATSSYQIEGMFAGDGRGECIWTRFSHTPGKIADGSNGDVACDHYHRFPEDVALMKALHMDAYRFSISWARVLPQGTGTINQIGLDFYDRLVDELLRNGITPSGTLYHWDLPQALEDRGGWTNPDIPAWFAEYTDVVARRLGDRVKFWSTLNEPWCTAFLGYWLGVHAPGQRDQKLGFRAAHQTLLAHAAAVPILRQHSHDAKVGITLNLVPHDPASDKPEDVRVARMADVISNDWFLDPVFRGEYPAEALAELTAMGLMEGIDASEVKAAKLPLDFLGVNYYMRWVHEYDPSAPGQSRNRFPDDAEFTDIGWEVYERGLLDTLLKVHRDYSPAEIYINECGAAYSDPDQAEGEIVEDPKRVAFLRRYLGAAESALHQGVPLKGWFTWSLLDNFEWAEGYSKRFGIVHVDFATQKRTLKRSGIYMREVAKTGDVGVSAE